MSKAKPSDSSTAGAPLVDLPTIPNRIKNYSVCLVLSGDVDVIHSTVNDIFARLNAVGCYVGIAADDAELLLTDVPPKLPLLNKAWRRRVSPIQTIFKFEV